ncbi:MAG TPA: hypothetical protein VFJ78_06790 [Gaiellaceae bacterium]|nr:hypothetical protein [Gaiellaceae bacterium]
MAAPVDTSPSLGGLFAISLGLAYGAVAKLPHAESEEGGSNERLTPETG